MDEVLSAAGVVLKLGNFAIISLQVVTRIGTTYAMTTYSRIKKA